MKLNFDEFTNDIIVHNGSVVMTRGEEPYFMELFSSLSRLQPKRVLEIGYGLGISASLIQKHLSPATHIIVEIEEQIGRNAQNFASNHQGVEVITKDWFDVEFKGTFDFIFLDPFDYINAGSRTKDDVSNKIKNLLSYDGVLSHPHFGDGEVSHYNDLPYQIIKRFKTEGFTTGDGVSCQEVASLIRCKNENALKKALKRLQFPELK